VTGPRPAPPAPAPVTRMWAPNGVRVDSAYLTGVPRPGAPRRDSWLNPPDRDGAWLTVAAPSGVVLGYVYAGGGPAATAAALARLAAGLGSQHRFDPATLTATRPAVTACRAHHARLKETS
jgi:hypothetical protein